MEQKATYLRVTIHDNDFRFSLELVGEALQEIFEYIEEYPTEEDFPVLKQMIKYIWYGIHHVYEKIDRVDRYYEVEIDYFEPDLEFVDFFDIPDWDNGENIYIPMFDDGKIFWR